MRTAMNAYQPTEFDFMMLDILEEQVEKKAQENYLSELGKVMNITNYKGCLIEQRADGFYVTGMNRGLTMESAQQYIDKGFKALAKSIVN
jgi:hypothetical protein